MGLFSERLVEDVRRLPGAEHSFLRQLCGVRAGRYRNAIEALVEDLCAAQLARAQEQLTSLDNRRFFQGYAEVATARFLGRGRLRVHDVAEPGGCLQTRTLSGPGPQVAVLSFLHKGRSGPDRATVQRLSAALDRVGTRRRLAVIVHSRLPEDFDTEEVRRAVDAWLGEVERGLWQGRYATFVDEQRGIHLEFGLTGRTVKRGARVCFVLGPFLGPAALLAAEPRLIAELNRHHLGPQAGQPLLLVCFADQPWAVGQGALRDFLFGQARSMCLDVDGEARSLAITFRGGPAAALFRDPVFSDLVGVAWLGRDGEDPTRVRAALHLNPWANLPLDPDLLPPVPVLAPSGREGGEVTMAWRGERGAAVIDLL